MIMPMFACDCLFLPMFAYVCLCSFVTHLLMPILYLRCLYSDRPASYRGDGERVSPPALRMERYANPNNKWQINVVLLKKIAFFPHILPCLLKFSAFIFIENYNHVGWNKRVGRIFFDILIIV